MSDVNDSPVSANEDQGGLARVENVETDSRYRKRQSELPRYLEDSVKCNIDYYCQLSDMPQTYQEVVSSTDAAKWQESMEDQMKSLTNNQTFTVTQLLDGRTSVGGGQLGIFCEARS